MDVKGKLTAPSRKMAVFLDAEVGKKETPSKGCLCKVLCKDPSLRSG